MPSYHPFVERFRKRESSAPSTPRGQPCSTCSIACSFMGDDVVTVVSLDAIGNTRFSTCFKEKLEVRDWMEREQGSHGLDTVVVADRSNGCDTSSMVIHPWFVC